MVGAFLVLLSMYFVIIIVEFDEISILTKLIILLVWVAFSVKVVYTYIIYSGIMSLI